MRKAAALFLLCLYLPSCGYRWQPDFPTASRPTLTVPFIPGDEDGMLTAEIVRAVTASGLAYVRGHHPQYRLIIQIKNVQNQTIGYRRDPQKVNGKVRKNVLAAEGRKSVVVEATLYQADSEKIACGPYEITGDADYDYIDGDSIQDLTFTDAKGVQQTVLPFSLGQLEPIESAQEAASRPLYASLAQKIVDAIFSEW